MATKMDITRNGNLILKKSLKVQTSTFATRGNPVAEPTDEVVERGSKHDE